MEGSHGELRAGFADGLGGDDADRLAEIHQTARAEVQAIALGADATTGFAGEGGADLDLGDAAGLDRERQLFGEQGAGGRDGLGGIVGIHDVVKADPAHDAVAQA